MPLPSVAPILASMTMGLLMHADLWGDYADGPVRVRVIPA
jgi:hypothetical protein